MKDTNAIEQALKDKSKKEIEKVVNVFMNELEIKIRGEYGSTNYYDFFPQTIMEKQFFTLWVLNN